MICMFVFVCQLHVYDMHVCVYVYVRCTCLWIMMCMLVPDVYVYDVYICVYVWCKCLWTMMCMFVFMSDVYIYEQWCVCLYLCFCLMMWMFMCVCVFVYVWWHMFVSFAVILRRHLCHKTSLYYQSTVNTNKRNYHGFQPNIHISTRLKTYQISERITPFAGWDLKKRVVVQCDVEFCYTVLFYIVL